MRRGTAEIYPVRPKAMPNSVPTPAESKPPATTPKAAGLAPCTNEAGIAMQPGFGDQNMTCPAGGADDYLQAAHMMVQQQLAHQAQQAASAVAMQEWLVQQQVLLQTGGPVHPVFAQGVAQAMGQSAHQPEQEPAQHPQQQPVQQPQQVETQELQPAQTAQSPYVNKIQPAPVGGCHLQAGGKGAPSAAVSSSPHEHQVWQDHACAAPKAGDKGGAGTNYHGYSQSTSWSNDDKSWRYSSKWDTNTSWKQNTWDADQTWNTNTTWQTDKTWCNVKTWNHGESWDASYTEGEEEDDTWRGEREPEPEETEEVKKFSVVLDSETHNFPCPFDQEYVWLRMKKPPPAAGLPHVVPAKRKTVPHPDDPPARYWQYREETEEVECEAGH